MKMAHATGVGALTVAVAGVSAPAQARTGI